METSTAIRTLDLLAQGTDPVTGKPLPDVSPYNQPAVLRSLIVALKALQLSGSDTTPVAPITAELAATAGTESKSAARQPKAPPANAGKPWTPDEDLQLCQEFDKGVAVKEIAVLHSRSTTALNARLFKLGKIADPGIPLRSRV